MCLRTIELGRVRGSSGRIHSLRKSTQSGNLNPVTQRRGLDGAILATQQGSISRKRMQQVPSQDLQCEFLNGNREQEVKALRDNL